MALSDRQQKAMNVVRADLEVRADLKGMRVGSAEGWIGAGVGYDGQTRRLIVSAAAGAASEQFVAIALNLKPGNPQGWRQSSRFELAFHDSSEAGYGPVEDCQLVGLPFRICKLLRITGLSGE